jgi:hypothetical protein
MTRLRCVLLASTLVSIPAVGLVVSGCSSSSSSATPGTGTEGGAEASVEAGPYEAGEAGKGGLKLQWLVQAIGSKIGLVEAGAPSEAGAEAGGTEGGTDEGGVYGSSDAGDAGQGDGSVPGLEGVKVCVYQNTDIPCTTTAADGTFTLTGFSALTNVALTLDKAGFQPTLLSIQTASTDMDGRQYPVYMADTDGGAPPIGTAVDTTAKGQLTTFVLGQSPTANGDFSGEPGASMTLAPMSGVGPFYLAQGNIVEGATAYTDNGLQALYYNLAPGMYTLTYNDPDPMKDCEAVLFPFDSRGIAGAMGSHQVSFPIVAGYTTGNIGEICTKGAAIVAIDGGHD